jgi:hypothetical protein
MQILEDHNRQLEAQLQRLRQLLDEPKPSSPSKTGTLQSKSVVAAELAMDSPLPQRANGHTTEPVSTSTALLVRYRLQPCKLLASFV